jgi:hypothetical protein
MPRLENWEIVNDYYRGCYRLQGIIYDDDRFPDGTNVSTSRLMNVDFENEKAQTRNTNYILGKRKPYEKI